MGEPTLTDYNCLKSNSLRNRKFVAEQLWAESQQEKENVTKSKKTN